MPMKCLRLRKDKSNAYGNWTISNVKFSKIYFINENILVSWL